MVFFRVARSYNHFNNGKLLVASQKMKYRTLHNCVAIKRRSCNGGRSRDIKSARGYKGIAR